MEPGPDLQQGSGQGTLRRPVNQARPPTAASVIPNKEQAKGEFRKQFAKERAKLFGYRLLVIILTGLAAGVHVFCAPAWKNWVGDAPDIALLTLTFDDVLLFATFHTKKELIHIGKGLEKEAEKRRKHNEVTANEANDQAQWASTRDEAHLAARGDAQSVTPDTTTVYRRLVDTIKMTLALLDHPPPGPDTALASTSDGLEPDQHQVPQANYGSIDHAPDTTVPINQVESTQGGAGNVSLAPVQATVNSNPYYNQIHSDTAPETADHTADSKFSSFLVTVRNWVSWFLSKCFALPARKWYSDCVIPFEIWFLESSLWLQGFLFALITLMCAYASLVIVSLERPQDLTEENTKTFLKSALFLGMFRDSHFDKDQDGDDFPINRIKLVIIFFRVWIEYGAIWFIITGVWLPGSFLLERFTTPAIVGVLDEGALVFEPDNYKDEDVIEGMFIKDETSTVRHCTSFDHEHEIVKKLFTVCGMASNPEGVSFEIQTVRCCGVVESKPVSITTPSRIEDQRSVHSVRAWGSYPLPYSNDGSMRSRPSTGLSDGKFDVRPVTGGSGHDLGEDTASGANKSEDKLRVLLQGK